MIAAARHADLALLFWINQAWAGPWLDRLFVFVTEPRHFLVAAVLAAAALGLKGGARGRRLLLCLAVGVALSDPLSSRVIKRWAGRTRPCRALTGLRLPDGDRGSLSFPSSHAVNLAAAATIAGAEYPAWSWALALFALLVGLSRVYLGLHYPSDVLGGFAIGIAIGGLVAVSARRWRSRSSASHEEGEPAA